MYLNHRVKNSALRLRRQQGFLIPLALFIVVVLGFLALAMSRTTVQTGLASAQELVSTQAFYAAESGAQAGMGNLFYPNPGDQAQVNNRCENMNLSPTINDAPGLGGCNVTVTCECEVCGADDLTSFYTIESRGECGSGTTAATRTIRVGTYMGRQ